MGSVREVSSGRTYVLEPEHVVGRAPSCSLRIDRKYVSAQHAALRWSGNRWEVRDLGSRNGTFLNGTRLKAGEEQALQTGAVIAFGKLLEQQWEVVDSAPPTVMAVPVDGGEPVLLDGD